VLKVKKYNCWEEFIFIWELIKNEKKEFNKKIFHKDKKIIKNNKKKNSEK